MRVRFLVPACCVVLIVAFAGCGGDSVVNLDAPEELTLYSIDGRGPNELYSIDGRGPNEGEAPKTEEKFHGYPVLGKVEITAADRRKEIVAALKKGMVRSDGKMAKCFSPRHAIRAVEKGRIIDCVICFECYQLEVHEGDSKSVKPTTREPQEVFNRHLKQAGVPLAPGMVGDDK